MTFHKSLIAATAALMFAGAAHAVTESGTLEKGGTMISNGYEFSDLSGSGTLSFSKLLITALNLAAVDVQAVAPATKQQTGQIGDDPAHLRCGLLRPALAQSTPIRLRPDSHGAVHFHHRRRGFLTR